MVEEDQKKKTYSTRDSLVAADLATSLAIIDLMYGKPGGPKKAALESGNGRL